MPYFKRSNIPIYYETSGSRGPTIVLLRGLGRSVSHWDDFQTLMSKRMRVICMEFRGVGMNSDAPLGWFETIWTQAEDVAALLDHLEISKSHIFGISLGGMVTLAFALKYPHRCSSLIIANSSLPRLGTMRLTWKGIFTLLSLGLWPSHSHERLAKVLRAPERTEQQINETAQRWRHLAKLRGLQSYTALKQLLFAMRFNVKHKLPSCQVPALVLIGKQDQFVPTKNSTLISQLLPQCRVGEIDGAGHEITLDQPEKVEELIYEFVSANNASSRLKEYKAPKKVRRSEDRSLLTSK